MVIPVINTGLVIFQSCVLERVIVCLIFRKFHSVNTHRELLGLCAISSTIPKLFKCLLEELRLLLNKFRTRRHEMRNNWNLIKKYIIIIRDNTICLSDMCGETKS